MIQIPNDFQVQSAYLVYLERATTKGKDGIPNGWLMNIANENLGIGSIEQVYTTTCTPYSTKGPHCHLGSKVDRFYCISGAATIICRNEQTQEYSTFLLDQTEDNKLLIIPPYNSHAIVCKSVPATILSMPSEGYNPDKEYNQVETEYDLGIL